MLNKIIYPTILFLTPLLFLTFTPNFFTTPKQLLLVLAVILLVLNWAFPLLASRTLPTSSSPLRFGLAAFVVAILLNLVLNKEGRVEALIGPTCIYLALSVWTYFLTLHKNSSLHDSILHALLGSTFIIAVHTILQLTLLHSLTFLPLYMQSRAFTLTGGLGTTFIFLIFGFAISLLLLLKSTARTKSIFIVSTVLHTISLIALGFLLLPGQELALNLLPLSASWSIALDALKSLHSFFFGVGLANFSIFYRSVKPLFLNTTPFWNILPTSSGSEFLNLVTTTGLIGFLSFLSLPLLTIKSHLKAETTDKKTNLPFKLLFILATLALIFSPSSIPLLLVFFTTLGVLNSAAPHAHSFTRPVSLVLALAILLMVGLTGYYSVRVIAAELDMRQAQKALAVNDGKLVYEKSIAAIKLVPGLTSYRISNSQVNLSIAAALSQKGSLAPAERQNISQLISQAISEGKLAATLSPNDSTAWQNLGNLYRNLVNVATGADQFAISSYSQAVALDPGNPLLRLEFGGFLYQLGQSAPKASDATTLYASAQSEFQTAIQLKPDYPNSYYNLAKLFEATKDYQNAYLAMQKTLSLLGPNSPDLGTATTELENLKTKLPASPAPSSVPSTQLVQPSPLPSPIDGGPLTIPQ